MKGLHLHLDCASGIAGDMTLAALIDAGVPVGVIGDALDAVGAGRERLIVSRVVKHGFAAVDVKVKVDGGGVAVGAHAHDHDHDHDREHDHHHGHDHEHEHDHHHERDHHHEHDHVHVHWADIRKTLESKLEGETRRIALDMFGRVARAEAKIHGKSVDDVAFHEVGAIDSIVDIVGTAAALAWLAPASVTCREVAMGHGTVRCAHGVIPVPSPAAVEILTECGGVMADGGVARELCTPTGAAILASAVTAWTPAPTGTPVAVGWGAGDMDLADRANVLRAVVMRKLAAEPLMWRIEANIDDMSPELCGHAAEMAFAAGAVDAWWAPITMKKGRPALLFGALAPADKRDAVIAAILAETTTIGVRYDAVDRKVLDRVVVEVPTGYGAIRVKLARDGARVVNAAPEHEDCVAAARAHGVPLKSVYAAALAAYTVSSAGG
jgi:pyridinium-3,5-bisthiocarboxylic acid mononucleotide nickel chelatase